MSRKIKNQQGSQQRQWPSGDQCQKGNVNNDPRVADFNLSSFKIGTISHIKSENRFIFPAPFHTKKVKNERKLRTESDNLRNLCATERDLSGFVFPNATKIA